MTLAIGWAQAFLTPVHIRAYSWSWVPGRAASIYTTVVPYTEVAGKLGQERGWSTLMGFSSWWFSQILGVSGPLGSQGWTGFCFWLGVEIVRPGGIEQEFRQELPLLAWAPENMETEVFQYQPGSRSNEGI